MSITQLFSFFRKTQSAQNKDKSRQSFYRSIYPESVRYAFQYRGAEMGKVEMLALLDSYIFESVYLLTKAVGFNREYQQHYLEDLTRLYMQTAWQKQDLENLLWHYIALLPDNITVTGKPFSLTIPSTHRLHPINHGHSG